MTLKTIWTTNYLTIVALALMVSFAMIDNRNNSDITTTELTSAIGSVTLFILYVSYLYFENIFKSGIRSRKQYYLSAFLPMAISVYLLFLLIPYDAEHPLYVIILVAFSGLNVVTYWTGLVIK